MKRFVPLTMLLIGLCMFTATAQETIVYDFEEGVMPEGFTLINRDMLVPNEPDDAVFADSAWIVINSGLLESFAAVSLSWYVNDDGPADDWMILPKIEVTDNSTLSWVAQSTTSSGNFPDSYQVLVNAGEPIFESFESDGNLLLTIDPEEYETAQMRELSLSDFAGQSIHIAFRNITGSGDALLIDDITITEAGLVNSRAVDNKSFNFELAPNPAINGTSQITYTLEQSSPVQIRIQDMAGRTLRSQAYGQQASGRHQLELPVDGLAPGAYLVSLRTEDKIGSTRLIVK